MFISNRKCHFINKLDPTTKRKGCFKCSLTSSWVTRPQLQMKRPDKKPKKVASPWCAICQNSWDFKALRNRRKPHKHLKNLTICIYNSFRSLWVRLIPHWARRHLLLTRKIPFKDLTMADLQICRVRSLDLFWMMSRLASRCIEEPPKSTKQTTP